jgi:hypothetical protein
MLLGQWAGHMDRIRETRNAYRILMEKPLARPKMMMMIIIIIIMLNLERRHVM